MDQIGCKEEDVAWNMTTTNRRGTKTSTIFSVFLLTRIGQELILRIADFGGRGSARAGFSASGGMTGLEATSPPSTKQHKDATTCGAQHAPSRNCREAFRNEEAQAGYLPFCNEIER
jgi:hypothetical protein